MVAAYARTFLVLVMNQMLPNLHIMSYPNRAIDSQAPTPAETMHKDILLAIATDTFLSLSELNRHTVRPAPTVTSPTATRDVEAGTEMRTDTTTEDDASGAAPAVDDVQLAYERLKLLRPSLQWILSNLSPSLCAEDFRGILEAYLRVPDNGQILLAIVSSVSGDIYGPHLPRLLAHASSNKAESDRAATTTVSSDILTLELYVAIAERCLDDPPRDPQVKQKLLKQGWRAVRRVAERDRSGLVYLGLSWLRLLLRHYTCSEATVALRDFVMLVQSDPNVCTRTGSGKSHVGRPALDGVRGVVSPPLSDHVVTLAQEAVNVLEAALRDILAHCDRDLYLSSGSVEALVDVLPDRERVHFSVVS